MSRLKLKDAPGIPDTATEAVMPKVEVRLVPPIPPEPKPAPAAPPPQRPCALDGAPIHSKIVVVQRDKGKCPILATPQGESVVSENDIAYKLPPGARVKKEGEARYVAEQLNPMVTKPPLVTTTARAAIEQFVSHFHEM